MKAFKIVPSIAEYVDFRTLAKELKLGARDLILTNEYIYNPTIAALELGCHTCFQEKFGGGEPTRRDGGCHPRRPARQGV